MDLSIIIPTYNRANLIRFTLDSLRKEHHRNQEYEVIVIDDGSDDDTEAIVRNEFSGVLFLKNKGKGASAARNTGLAAATGKYITYLDSDDLAGENCYIEKIKFFEQNIGIDACYGDYDYFESDGAFSNDSVIFKNKYPVIATADNARAHLINYLGGNFLPSNCIVWRKSFIKQIKGHDDSLKINQDVDLFVRALLNGLNIAAVSDNTKVYVRHHFADSRVGSANNREKKVQVLELRKSIYADLKKYQFNDAAYYRALSMYLFNNWRQLRHTEPIIAAEFLKFAKEVCWPIEIKGNFGMLAKIVGPVNAVNIKYLLLKRD